ncbi:MAG: hypothetical protein AUI62_03070 [Thaumarchaeota archaeon 13_1_40CM_2_39_7]|nr:MAG: hypothetical protein AUI62_03070 [Thaumarchaeota archaeon 13_1_40CM_2_39_7]
MEEIAIVLSSLAGACTAVALDKIPKLKHNKQPLTVNLALENQLQSLRTEKEILTKTIARLHQKDSGLSGIHKDKLLIRYQHQLGTIIARIEKLEVTSRYPDLGPIGDNLISLMDNKLSQLDQRLHEISSKIVLNALVQTKQPGLISESVQEKPQIRKIETIEDQKDKVKEGAEIQKDRTQTISPSIEISTQQRHRSVELSTLTEITNKIPEFPAEFIKPSAVEANQILEDAVKTKTSIKESPVVPANLVKSTREENITQEPEPLQESENKIQLPKPIKIPEEEKLDDDDKDLDKIKSEIMKALSKLEQVEVE